MAAFIPFEPAIQSGSAGKTVSITVTSTTQGLAQIVSSTAENPSILVTAVNNTATAITAYLRMSVESSTAITATVTDMPVFLAPNTINGTYVRLLANPAPIGIANFAVVVSVATSTAGCTFYFTPGQGGDV